MKNILLFLAIFLLLSGCVDKTPTKNDLENSQLVDSYCKSKGFDYGATKYFRTDERWDVLDGSFYGNMMGTSMTDTSILCIKQTKMRNVFFGSDYKEYVDKVIYINTS